MKLFIFAVKWEGTNPYIWEAGMRDVLTWNNSLSSQLIIKVAADYVHWSSQIAHAQQENTTWKTREKYSESRFLSELKFCPWLWIFQLDTFLYDFVYV